MRFRSMLLAGAVAAGLSTSAMADLTGKVTYAGKPPEAKQIDMSGVKECNDKHPDPVYEENLVVGEKGELANVVVSIKKEDSPDLTGEVPKDPAVLDQKGCMYVPHVVAMMVGQPSGRQERRQRSCTTCTRWRSTTRRSTSASPTKDDRARPSTRTPRPPNSSA